MGSELYIRFFITNRNKHTHTSFAIVITFINLSLVSATDFGIRVLLNKGQSLPTGEACSGSEWLSIRNTIDTTINTRYPAWCAEKCRGFAPNTCIGAHPSCNGYRKLDEQEEENAVETINSFNMFPIFRDLFVATTCQGQIDELNTATNNLQPLSSQCRTVLNAQREFTCLPSATFSVFN
jgi:hypothetical protein